MRVTFRTLLKPRPTPPWASSARLRRIGRRESDPGGLGFVQHQDRRASFGLNVRLKPKASLLVSAPRANIVDRRIDRDQRRALRAKPFREQPQIRLAMAAPDHRGQADKAVDRARALRQMPKMRLRPGVDLVVLRVGERPSV